ncbi:MAG: AAA family ATPase [Proteobacteria bacterium]|nr:AAA family ATPase [Pseudomonadota bacterium]
MNSAAPERPHYRASGYQMINSIKIRNFRSFSDVKIDDCRRINIIVGENGSGKTALLEALYLAVGVSPDLVMRTRIWRGYDSARMSGTVEDLHQALWADLFHKFQTNKRAVVSLKGSAEQTRSVTVTLHPAGKRLLKPPPRKRSGAPPKVVPHPSPIEFKWDIHGHGTIKVEPRFEGDKLIFDPVPPYHVKGSFFAANQAISTLETANRFSNLSRKFRHEEFIKSFNHLYENITNLSVEVTAGSPMLFAVVNGLPEKIPLTLASGGMSKLAGILLAIPEQAGGVILIDEIENGFYYRRLPMVWKAILDSARAYNCQIFASSHSAECLNAVAAFAEESPDEFSVIRTVLKEGEVQVRQFGGDKFADAIAENIEIR